MAAAFLLVALALATTSTSPAHAARPGSIGASTLLSSLPTQQHRLKATPAWRLTSSAEVLPGCDARALPDAAAAAATRALVNSALHGAGDALHVTCLTTESQLESTAGVCPSVTRMCVARHPIHGVLSTSVVTTAIVPPERPTLEGVALAPSMAAWACGSEARPALPAVSAAARDGCGRALAPMYLQSPWIKTPGRCSMFSAAKVTAQDCAGRTASSAPITATLTITDPVHARPVITSAPTAITCTVRLGPGMDSAIPDAPLSNTELQNPHWLGGDCEHTDGSTGRTLPISLPAWLALFKAEGPKSWCAEVAGDIAVSSLEVIFEPLPALDVTLDAQPFKVGVARFSPENDCGAADATADVFLRVYPSPPPPQRQQQ